jgi:6-phosphogluconolactonase
MDIYKPKLNHHEDELVMIESIKNYFLNFAEDAIYNTGTFRVAVAGGNTPKLLYTELSKLSLDWSNIEFYQVDERFIDPENDKSNQKMIKKTLAEAIDKGMDFYPINIKGTIEETVKLYDTEISLLDTPIFDLVLLGAGTDGHLASLFPNESYLNGEVDSVIATNTTVHDVKERISLSLNTILSSSNIFVYITGEEKYGIIEESFYGNRRASEFPIKFLFAHPEVTFFYCEEEAE